jgi:hypothetical protein
MSDSFGLGFPGQGITHNPLAVIHRTCQDRCWPMRIVHRNWRNAIACAAVPSCRLCSGQGGSLPPHQPVSALSAFPQKQRTEHESAELGDCVDGAGHVRRSCASSGKRSAQSSLADANPQRGHATTSAATQPEALSQHHRPEHEPNHPGSAKSEHDAALEAAHDLGCELVFGHWIVSCDFSPAQRMQRSPRCGLAALSDRVRCPALGLALSATEGTFA